jgi:hypothetical protein
MFELIELQRGEIARLARELAVARADCVHLKKCYDLCCEERNRAERERDEARADNVAMRKFLSHEPPTCPSCNMHWELSAYAQARTKLLEADNPGQPLSDELDRLRKLTMPSALHDLLEDNDRLNKLVSDLTKERDNMLAAIPEARKD